MITESLFAHPRVIFRDPQTQIKVGWQLFIVQSQNSRSTL